MKTKGTGISLSPERMDRLTDLAKELGVSRNETIGLLIEGAQVVSRPAVNVVFVHQANTGALQEGVLHAG